MSTKNPILHETCLACGGEVVALETGRTIEDEGARKQSWIVEFDCGARHVYVERDASRDGLAVVDTLADCDD